jgi:hypothetical protein
MASQPRATSIGPGIHGTGSASYALAPVIISAEILVLQINEVFVLAYFDRIILPSKNCSTSGK